MKVGHLIEAGGVNEARMTDCLISCQCSNSVVSYFGQGSGIVLKVSEVSREWF